VTPGTSRAGSNVKTRYDCAQVQLAFSKARRNHGQMSTLCLLAPAFPRAASICAMPHATSKHTHTTIRLQRTPASPWTCACSRTTPCGPRPIPSKARQGAPTPPLRPVPLRQEAGLRQTKRTPRRVRKWAWTGAAFLRSIRSCLPPCVALCVTHTWLLQHRCIAEGSGRRLGLLQAVRPSAALGRWGALCALCGWHCYAVCKWQGSCLVHTQRGPKGCALCTGRGAARMGRAVLHRILHGSRGVLHRILHQLSSMDGAALAIARPMRVRQCRPLGPPPHVRMQLFGSRA